jgi:uncharacterized membrane-anchored protein YitT (DUF2179 family)
VKATETSSTIPQGSASSALRLTPREQIWSILILLLGASIQAFAYAAFMVPYQIAAGGMGGLSLIISHLTGFPVGATYFVLNIPMFLLGYLNLGRWQFLGKTLLGVAVFSVLTDVLLQWLPSVFPYFPITDNMLLSAIYGGIVGGIGGGLIYRSGAGGSGTSILGRVIQIRTGAPLSQILLFTDGLIVLSMGVVFGWETSLYALLMLFLWGLASDYVLEGPSSVRTVMIVTGQPDAVLAALRLDLGRTASHWTVTGGYSGEDRQMIMCTVQRPQVNALKRIVNAADPTAFYVIGDAHQAVGGDFTPRTPS